MDFLNRFVFLSFTLIFLAAPAKAASNSLQDNLQSDITLAKEFLCQKAFCITENVPIAVEDSEGYYAYYHSSLSRISLSRNLSNTERKLDLVHEFTHVYRHKFNSSEEAWLDEGLAKLMEYQYSHNVWPFSYESKLKQNPNLVLSNDRRVDYGREGMGYASSFWLVLYLYNHFGGEKLIEKLMRSRLSGWDNLEDALRVLQQSGDIAQPANLLNRKSIIRHFAVAMWTNDAFKARYGLFEIDPRHEALALEPKVTTIATVVPMAPIKNGVKITYSHLLYDSSASEVYAIHSGLPTRLDSSSSQKIEPADIFIYIYD